MANLFETKSDIILEDLKDLQPAIWIIFTGALLYCHRNNLTCRITSIISDRTSDEIKKKQSRVHPEGRGIDIGISGRGWNDIHVHRLAFQLCSDYADLGAISASDGVARACVVKKDHLHLQCRRGADISKFITK